MAGRLSPAATWHEALASTLYELDGVTASWVCICPPGYPFLARGAALPHPIASNLLQQFLRRELPMVERQEFSTRMVRRHGSNAVRVSMLPGSEQREDEVIRVLFERAGVTEMINAFLVTEPGKLVGWIALGVSARARPRPEPLVAGLTRVAQLASNSLADALLIARSLGARVPVSEHVVKRRLSERESEIAAMVSRGWSDLNIAHRLRISEHTVATHLRRVFAKLGLHSRAELAGSATWLAPADRSSSAR